MSHPFCPDMRHAIIYALNQFGCPHYDESIYCCTEGPRLETPAEINLYHSYGADLVGMTLAPEVFLARELEMCYAAVCYLTNFAEGLATRDYKSGVLFEGMMTDKEKVAVDSSLGKIPSIVTSAFQAIVNHDRECDCKNAMLRYRERGDIKDDWRTWIDP
jgi:5'-methylthioadenosine phosphorylase